MVELHPCGTAVEFIWNPTGEVEAWAKTSTVGPGYHAYVIDLLQAVGRELHLEWRWDEGNSGDETGYVQNQDFPALENEFASFLGSLGQIFLQQAAAGATNLMVNMTAGALHPMEGAFCWSPCGPLSRQWWEMAVEPDPNEILRIEAEFYPWWDKEANADFWRKTAMRHPLDGDPVASSCQRARGTGVQVGVGLYGVRLAAQSFCRFAAPRSRRVARNNGQCVGTLDPAARHGNRIFARSGTISDYREMDDRSAGLLLPEL